MWVWVGLSLLAASDYGRLALEQSVRDRVPCAELIVADWLEEHGDLDRANYIRDPDPLVLEKHYKQWNEEIGLPKQHFSTDIHQVGYRRGFPYRIDVQARDLKKVPEILSRFPTIQALRVYNVDQDGFIHALTVSQIQQLSHVLKEGQISDLTVISVTDDSLRALGNLSEIWKIKALGLFFTGEIDSLHRFFNASFLPSTLESLSVRYVDRFVEAAPVMETIAHRFQDLRALEIGGFLYLSTSSIKYYSTHRSFRSLEIVGFRPMDWLLGIRTALSRHWIFWKGFPALRVLKVGKEAADTLAVRHNSFLLRERKVEVQDLEFFPEESSYRAK